jgi:hypothetical protein
MWWSSGRRPSGDVVEGRRQGTRMGTARLDVVSMKVKC